MQVLTCIQKLKFVFAFKLKKETTFAQTRKKILLKPFSI